MLAFRNRPSRLLPLRDFLELGVRGSVRVRSARFRTVRARVCLACVYPKPGLRMTGRAVSVKG